MKYGCVIVYNYGIILSRLQRDQPVFPFTFRLLAGVGEQLTF